MSFRLKTILGVAIIEAVLLFILIVSAMSLLRASNEEELLKRAYSTAGLFASAARDPAFNMDLSALQSFVDQLLNNEGVVYVRVISNRGTVLASGGDAAALKRPFRADRALDDVDDAVFDAYADMQVGDLKQGRVEIGFSTHNIQQVLQRARARTVGIALIEMILVALFSYALGVYLTRGLRDLREASAQMAAGQLGVQVPIAGKDELAETARTFNDMSLRLKQADDDRRRAEEALQKLNEDLERRVRVRTEQLADANRQLEFQAFHDSLTRLPNRTLFYDRLEQAVLTGKRENRAMALMVLDLDRFKTINDTHGHVAGDLVLQTVAVRLQDTLRASDTIARLGGDEFALLLPTIKDGNTALLTANKVVQALRQPMPIDGLVLDVGASIGIALFPHDGVEKSELLRRADSAMYAAKRAGTGACLYAATHDIGDAAAEERHLLQRELAAAIEGGTQFLLHYQPKVDLDAGRINGIEALLRWDHPRHGLLYPDDFIPLAEESGLGTRLTTAVLDLALARCRSLQAAGHALTVSVNVSASNLRDETFPAIVTAALKRAGVLATSLELEVSETAIMLDPTRSIRTVTRLAEMGVQVAIDDFGTGYSSLAYLKKLPIAKIKIDKSFVIDMEARGAEAEIVRSIIGLGHSLGFNVVAEGVETQTAWNWLKMWGCNALQGYRLSRPMPEERLDGWLKEFANAGLKPPP